MQVRDKESTGIKPVEIITVSQEDIIRTNEINWKIRDRKYFNVYKETKQLSGFKDLVDGPPENLIKFVLKLYYECKILKPVSRDVYDAMLKLVEAIENDTDDIDKIEFLAKLDGLMDFIKDYGIE